MWALAGGSGGHAGFAEPAQALNQHRRGLEGIVAIDEVVEQLVIAGRCHVEEILDCGLFRSSKAPPITFELKDASFEVGQGRTLCLWIFQRGHGANLRLELPRSVGFTKTLRFSRSFFDIT